MTTQALSPRQSPKQARSFDDTTISEGADDDEDSREAANGVEGKQTDDVGAAAGSGSGVSSARVCFKDACVFPARRRSRPLSCLPVRLSPKPDKRFNETITSDAGSDDDDDHERGSTSPNDVDANENVSTEEEQE